ncbi:MAG: hypothetical protein ACYC1M_00805 [Armatimonadota bacterium]
MSVSRNLKLFAGLTAAVALFAGCGGGDNANPLELRPIVSGTSVQTGADQTAGPIVIGANYQVPQYSVVQAQVGAAAAPDYAVTTDSLPTGPLTNPPTLNQRGVAFIRATRFFQGGLVGTPQDPRMWIYLISQADALAPTTLAGKLTGRGGPYSPIITVADVRDIAIALRPGYYAAVMNHVPFYPGLESTEGIVIFRVCEQPLIVAGVSTFPTKVTMALPAYGQVMDHTSTIEIETDTAALATRAGFYMLHANGVSQPSEKGFIGGRSIVNGVDGGPALGNPISLITSWSL